MSDINVNATPHPSYVVPPAEPACRPGRGLKTEEGKRLSSRNAFTDGFTAQRTIVVDEDRYEHEDLVKRLREHVGSENVLQDVSFLHLVHHAWCLLRCQGIEEEVFAASRSPFADEGSARQVEPLTRYQTRCIVTPTIGRSRNCVSCRPTVPPAMPRPEARPRALRRLLTCSGPVVRKGNPLDPYGVDLADLERLPQAPRRENPDEFEDDEEAATAAI